MPFFEDSDYSQPLQEGIDYSDNLAGKVEEVEPESRKTTFPTLGDLVNSDRFKGMNEFRKAYTLAVYKNRLTQHMLDSGMVEGKVDFEQKIEKINESIRPHIPSAKSILGLKHFFTTNPGETIVAEGAGFMATQRAVGEASRIRNDMMRMAQAEAQKSVDSDPFIPNQSDIEDHIKKTDEVYKEWEELRKGAEQVLAEDVERTGATLIEQNTGGINAITLAGAANRMVPDLLAATASSMIAGPAGPLSYYAMTGAARSDRAQRFSNPDRDDSDRAERSLAVGTLSGSLEFIGFGFLTNGVRAKRLAEVVRLNVPASLQKIGGAAIAEGSTEFAQSVLETFGHNVEALDDFITIASDSETWQNALKEAGVGAILGAGVRGKIEVFNAAIPKIVQTEAYKKARTEIHKKLEKVDLSKRVIEPIADLSNSIIETSKLINEKGKELQNLEESREAGKEVGQAIAEDATKRDLPPASETTFTAEEVDGRYSQDDVLTAFEAREQGEDPSVQDSNLDAKDFIPGIDGQSLSEVIRGSIIENGGIDIENSNYFKDSLQDADGKPVFSPKFRAKRGRKGLTLDQHIEILAEQGVVPNDINPDVIIEALNGDKNNFKDQRNSQPSLLDLELLNQNSPNSDYNVEVEEALFFPDPNAKPEPIKQSEEPAPPAAAEQIVPVEAMLVPFNVESDPQVGRDVTRKVRDIAKIVERDLGIPVRQGKFRAKALGIFKTNSKVIRTKLANDLQVIAHEAGHGLSDRFNLATDQDSSFDSELIPLGEKTSGKDYTVEQKREEGRAEFFREFMVDPEGAKKKAPKFHKAFTDAIASDPKTQAGVDKLSEAYADIVSQSARERVMSTQETPEEAEARKNKATVKDKLLSDEIRFLDKNAALRTLRNDVYGKKDVAILDDPHRLMQLSAGASDVANRFIESGIYDSSDNKISKGLLEILDGMSTQELKEFDGYLKALRARDLHERGKTVGLDPQLAKRSVSEWESLFPQFKRKQAELKTFTDGLMDYAVREGVTTREEANRMLEANPHYIPFARIKDRHGSNATGTVATPFKFIKGDASSTLSGLAALENNVLTTVRAAANMKVYKALHKMTSVPGSGQFIEEVSQYGKDEPIVSFVLDGKRKFLRVKDDLLFDTLTYSPASSAFGTGILSSLMTGIGKGASKMVNLTAIVTPAFVGKNAVRDTFAAGIQSKNNFIPVIDSIMGMWEVINNSEATQQFLRQGGGQATFTRQVADKVSLPKITQGTAAKVIRSINPFSLLSSISEKVELAPRVIEFKKTRDRLLAEGKTQAEALAQAAFDGRDLTIDFNVGGTWTKKANTLTPFLNANIQGKRKLWRTLMTKKGLTYTGMMVLGLEGILYALNQDDEEYDLQPEHVKDNYWLFKNPFPTSDPFMKVPKPQGYSWFSNRFRNALDSMNGKEKKAVKKFGERLWRDFNDEWQSAIPAIAKPILEISTNHSFFRNDEIVNSYLQALPESEQYTAYTSEVAKNIGPKIGLSPIYFDHLVYGYFTNWGKAATTSVDSLFLKNLEEAPTPNKDFGKSTMGELTGLKSFFASNPDYSAAPIQQVFEMHDEIAGLKRIVKNRTGEDRTKFIAENKELWDKRNTIQNAYRDIKGIGSKIRAIYDHKTMSPERKKRELRHLFDRMAIISQKALDKK